MSTTPDARTASRTLNLTQVQRVLIRECLDHMRDAVALENASFRAEIAECRDNCCEAARENATLRADRDALRVALRVVVDKGRPIPPDEPGEKAVGVGVYLEWKEWGVVIKALGGWGEEA